VLPTRVVDIGDGEDSPIRLQINQRGAQGQYAALSYCWGGDQPYKMIISNQNSYTKELASTVFPKTLSDAIRVCREVGLRYIWIDALCIIQDDPKDKARETMQKTMQKSTRPKPSSLSISTRTHLAPPSSEVPTPVIPISWMRSPSSTGLGRSKKCCCLPGLSCSTPIR
jgi:hypothetical protein